MAVDTRNKRASVLGVGLLAALVLPAPDSSLSSGDRAQLTGSYAGLDAISPIQPEGVDATAIYSRIVSARATEAE